MPSGKGSLTICWLRAEIRDGGHALHRTRPRTSAPAGSASASPPAPPLSLSPLRSPPAIRLRWCCRRGDFRWPGCSGIGWVGGIGRGGSGRRRSWSPIDRRWSWWPMQRGRGAWWGEGSVEEEGGWWVWWVRHRCFERGRRLTAYG